MKKKLLLIISMFLFMTNVKALTFNVDLTNIEDKGSNSLGTITKIDVANKELDLLFEEVGDEVNFELTITNAGNRAGTLREITVSGENDKISYTNNLPENGLAINGNDTNKVTINAKVLEGITKGKTTSNIKITYKYDEGSCPEGEIISEDESMCLCPEGYERNDKGVCFKPDPDDKIECKDGEIYNETKKICEEKTIDPPIDNNKNKIVPINPKTRDNIVLITLLFVVSGLGIYAAMFKKLKTSKQRKTAGAAIGTVTLALSFTVLAGVFGLDNLLGAIVNPITKTREIVIKVNEEYDPVITWDGDCDITDALTLENIFEGGSGTENDPYQIKTANQLACFAKSVNQGTTYEGQYIKQIKNIKLNDNLADQVPAGDLSGTNLWIAAGGTAADPWNTPEDSDNYFAGTFDGGNYKISGLYLTDDSSPIATGTEKGLFGYAKNAVFKNINLTDVYINTTGYTGALLGYGSGSLTLNNVKTYGTGNCEGHLESGVVSLFYFGDDGNFVMEDVENNIDLTRTVDANYLAGIISMIKNAPDSDEPNITFNRVTNNGALYSYGMTGSAGIVGQTYGGNALFNEVANTGNITVTSGTSFHYGGFIGDNYSKKLTITNSYNSGNIDILTHANQSYIGGLIGDDEGIDVIIDNSFNSGNIVHKYAAECDEARENGWPCSNTSDNAGGLIAFSHSQVTITNSFNTGNLILSSRRVGGIAGSINTYPYRDEPGTIDHCYNTGNIVTNSYMGGLIYEGSVIITNSYNKGNLTQYAVNQLGGLAVSVNAIYNSYNEGDIYITANTDGGGYVGGICRSCIVKNCYNRGNITSKNNSVSIAGISADSSVTNSYNSGNITLLDNAPRNNIMVGGISSNGQVTNSYNLGNITSNYTASRSAAVNGITNYTGATNSVNTGDITIKVKANVSPKNIFLTGISDTAINCFNAGTVSLLDSNSQPISSDILNNPNNVIYVGEIVGYYVENTSSTGNKFNTSPDKYSIGRVPSLYTVEQAELIGTYTTEDAPDILSIINAGEEDGGAFEILEGETLPTLKVFNN